MEMTAEVEDTRTSGEGIIAVDKTSIANWEGNRSNPGLSYMPAIIRFLGYNPLQPSSGWADRLVRCRTVLGGRKRNPRHGWAWIRVRWPGGNVRSGSRLAHWRLRRYGFQLRWKRIGQRT